MTWFMSARRLSLVVVTCVLSPITCWFFLGFQIEISGTDNGIALLTASTIAPFIVLPLAAIGLISRVAVPEEHSARPMQWWRLGWFVALSMLVGLSGLIGGFASPQHGLLAGARDGVAALCLGAIVLFFLDAGWVLLASSLYIAGFFMFGAQSDHEAAHAWVLPGQGIENAYSNLLTLALFVIAAMLACRRDYPTRISQK